MAGLVCGDFPFHREQVPELVNPLQERELGEGIHRKIYGMSIAERNRLRDEVDAHLCLRILGHNAEELFMCLGLDNHRKQPILERIVAKDVGKRS